MHLLATVEVNTSTSGGRYFKKAAYFLEVRSRVEFQLFDRFLEKIIYRNRSRLSTVNFQNEI